MPTKNKPNILRIPFAIDFNNAQTAKLFNTNILAADPELRSVPVGFYKEKTYGMTANYYFYGEPNLKDALACFFEAGEPADIYGYFQWDGKYLTNKTIDEHFEIYKKEAKQKKALISQGEINFADFHFFSIPSNDQSHAKKIEDALLNNNCFIEHHLFGKDLIYGDNIYFMCPAGMKVNKTIMLEALIRKIDTLEHQINEPTHKNKPQFLTEEKIKLNSLLFSLKIDNARLTEPEITACREMMYLSEAIENKQKTLKAPPKSKNKTLL